MTVGQLISELRRYPGSHEVFMLSDNEGNTKAALEDIFTLPDDPKGPRVYLEPSWDSETMDD